MLRIGIVGTGRIARRFVAEAEYVDGVRVSAICNPHPGSAERFARAFCRADAIALSEPRGLWDAVDAVYIASPHETHESYILDAIHHGKHVLCEKPMVLSAAQAEACFRFAKQKRVVLMEGIKTAYCPGYRQLLSAVRSGVIGDIRYVDACFTKLEAPDSRELTDTRYGGSFTELGSYVLLPAFDLFGDRYEEITFRSVPAENGLDLFTKAELVYPQGFATLVCGLGVKAEGRLLIAGTKGYITVPAPWWKTTSFEAHFEDPNDVRRFEAPFEKDGLRYELSAFLERCEAFREDERSMELSVFAAGLMEKGLKCLKKH